MSLAADSCHGIFISSVNLDNDMLHQILRHLRSDGLSVIRGKNENHIACYRKADTDKDAEANQCLGDDGGLVERRTITNPSEHDPALSTKDTVHTCCKPEGIRTFQRIGGR